MSFIALECIVPLFVPVVEWLKNGKRFVIDGENSVTGVRNYDSELDAGEETGFVYVLFLSKTDFAVGIFSCMDTHWLISKNEIDSGSNATPIKFYGTTNKLFFIDNINEFDNDKPIGIQVHNITHMDIARSFILHFTQIRTRVVDLYNSISNDNKLLVLLTICFTMLIFLTVDVFRKEIRACAETYARVAYILYDDDEKVFAGLRKEIIRIGKMKKVSRKAYLNNPNWKKLEFTQFIPRKKKLERVEKKRKEKIVHLKLR